MADAVRPYPRPRLIPLLPGWRTRCEPRAQHSGHWVEAPRPRIRSLLGERPRLHRPPSQLARLGGFPERQGPLLGGEIYPPRGARLRPDLSRWRAAGPEAPGAPPRPSVQRVPHLERPPQPPRRLPAPPDLMLAQV